MKRKKRMKEKDEGDEMTGLAAMVRWGCAGP